MEPMTEEVQVKAPRALTFGQKAVGIKFNPFDPPSVGKMRQHYADIIDQLNDLRESTGDPGVKRWCSTAITQAEIAQMCAVKAITWVTE